MDTLMGKIAQAKAAGEPMSPAWLYQQQRLKSVLNATKVEIAKFAADASHTATQQQASAVGAALAHAKKLTTQATAEALPGITGSFVHLNPENMKAIVGFLGDGSPLADLVNTLPLQTSEAVRVALTTGIGLGKGPAWMARQVDIALDMPRHRAETIMRTESQRAYRAVSQATYKANAHIVSGWTWLAYLDALTCPACMVMDGTEHAVDSTLDGHPRCRCAMVPRTKTWDELLGEPTGLGDTRPPVRSGKEWFSHQPAHVQQAILGKAKFKAFKEGTIHLDQIVARTDHPGWGTMRRERSLREIVAGKNPNWADQVAPKPPPPAPVVVQPNVAKAIAGQYAADNTAPLEAALASVPEGSQDWLNVKAALKILQGQEGPLLPLPDLAKAESIAAKLDQAAITKGFPSKGYSQTKAIYKAQANGTVGSKVGVIKELSWETKLTAQKALDLHGESLPKALRKIEKDAKVVKANEAAETAAKAALGDAQTAEQFDSSIGTLLAESQSALEDAKAGSTAYDVANAQHMAHEAVHWAYEDAQDAVKDLKASGAEAWVPKPGVSSTGTIHLSDDGWAVIDYEGSATGQILNPVQAQKLLYDFQPDLVPNPAKVNAFLNDLSDAEGYLVQHNVDTMESYLAQGLYNPQAAKDAKAALSEAKALFPPKPVPPSPAEIQSLVNQMSNGLISKIDASGNLLNAMAVGDESKVTLWKAVLKGYDEKVAAKAGAALPAPSPGFVSSVLDQMIDGDVALGWTKAKVQEVLASGEMYGTPISAEVKSNLIEALKQYEQHLAQEAIDNAIPVQVSGAPFKVADLANHGGTVGTHGAQPMIDNVTGEKWLFKPPKTGTDNFLATLDEITSRLQAKVGLGSPDTYVTTIGGKRGSIQRMFDAAPAFKTKLSAKSLTAGDRLAVQQQHVLDWLLSNHDAHYENFLKLPDGTMVGIDKGQAFKWMGQDRLDWDFHPNAHYGAPEPVYNTFWREFAQGGTKDALDPSQGDLAAFIKTVQGISDDELKAMLRPYAEEAAQQGKLVIGQGSFPGLTSPTIQANNVEDFLKAVVARKNNLAKDFQALYDKAAAERLKHLPDWKPTVPKPTKAKTAAKGKAALKGAPEPTAPTMPIEPTADIAHIFDGWLKEAQDRFVAHAPGKELSGSANWVKFEQVIFQQDRSALDHLLLRNYIDQAMHDRAVTLMDQAKGLKAAADVKHAAAMTKHLAAVKRYDKTLQDWKDANGIVETRGSYGLHNAPHFAETKEGAEWAWPRYLRSKDYSSADIGSINNYTGSGYGPTNRGLRDSEGKTVSARAKSMDRVMAKNPGLDDDIIVTRLSNLSYLGVSSSDPSSLIGSVNVEHGFLSTSVNLRGAMSGTRIHFRVPKGHKAAWVSGDGHGTGVLSSVGSSEAELILNRGFKWIVHDVYRAADGQWSIEAEIVPLSWTPPPGFRLNPLPKGAKLT